MPLCGLYTFPSRADSTVSVALVPEPLRVAPCDYTQLTKSGDHRPAGMVETVTNANALVNLQKAVASAADGAGFINRLVDVLRSFTDGRLW